MNFKLKTAAAAAISAGVLAGAIFASAQTTACFQFTQNMKLGSSGAQVLELQKTLNAKGFTVSTTGVGSAGMETSYFGAKTKAAAIKYQAANGIIQTGNVFALTRAALNANCTPTPGNNPPTTTSGSVTVALASVQPSNVVVSGAARAKLADLVFSGNGTVVSVKLMRTGVSNNTTLANVYLYDAATGVRLTDAASVLTDGTVTFNNAAGIFSVSGPKTISVLADIAPLVSGQSVGVNLIGYTVTGSAAAVVSGVNGPVLPVGSADLATAYFGSLSPTTTSMNAGTTGATVWSSALSIGTRSANLSSVTFKMIGSAPMDSLANVKLYVDGVQFANATAFSAAGYATFYSMTPLSLTTGSHTFDVRADVVKGSSRSFYVSLENAGDVALQDSQLYGANITIKNGSISGATISNLSAGTISISGGSLTVSQNSGFTTSSLVGGSTGQAIGSFKFFAYGEDVKVQQLSITVATTSSLTPNTSTKLNNVTVYVNGGAVTSGVQATLGTAFTVNLGSNLVVLAGSSAIVEVRGDLVDQANANITAGSLQVSLGAVSNGAQGMYSYNLVNVPAGSGQTLSINSGNVAYGATSGFTAANISKNQTGVKIASFSLQAGSSEAVNVTNIGILLSGSSTPATEYSNLRITDGSQTVVPVAGTNNFSVNYDVAAGQTKLIEVWVDTLEIANGKTIIASSTVTYRGRTSSVTNSASATAPTMTAASVSVATPTLVTASTLGARYMIGGSTVNSVATYNVVSTNGSATINDLSFTVAGTGVESLTIGSTVANVIGGVANFYGINLSVPSGSGGLSIPVAVKYSAVTATNQGGVPSASISTTTLTSMKYTAGGTQTTITPSVAANPMTLVASLPTVRKTSSGITLGVGTTTNAKIGTITVSADAKGDVTVFSLPYSVSASSIVVKVNGTDVTTLAGGTASATSTNFATGYRIGASQTATFDVYGTVANGGTSSSNYDVALGSSALFLWSDVVDGLTSSAGAKTGALLTTYN
ncbi:MAG: trimeric autotransporter adhesin [Candidatus Parcubacteria bacterium]